MVADYISTSWIGGKAFGVFIVGHPPSGGLFDVATYTVANGLNISAGGIEVSSAGDEPIVDLDSYFETSVGFDGDQDLFQTFAGFDLLNPAESVSSRNPPMGLDVF
jgi:hypothetical protein